MGIPLDVVLALVIVVIASLVYYETVFGLRLIGLGGNEEALAGWGTYAQFIARGRRFAYGWAGGGHAGCLP